MTPDPIDRLRAADPVPHPVGYADDDVTRRVADILADDGHRAVVLGDEPDEGRRPRWWAAGLAAAAVLVLAVVSAIVFTDGSNGNDKAAAGDSPVVCAVSSSGTTKDVRTRLTQAEVTITDRVRQLGGAAHSFVSNPDDGSIGFTPQGVSVAKAAQACRTTTLAFRPVVAPAVVADTRAPRSGNPLSALTFAIPSTDAAYARLTAAQRSALSAAMSHDNCAPAPTAGALACSTVAGRSTVLLLGPALITGPDVRSAISTAPDTGTGGSSTQWTVALSFRAAGAARFRAFTAAHHTSSSTATLSTCGPSGAVPCSDFLAITANGRVVTAPVTQATLESSVQISGDFTQASAQTLAGEVAAASIQLHPR